MAAWRLEARDLTKTFPGVVALDRVSFACAAGEVHALVGENGAGKSTLMKVLAGVYPPDAGQVLIDGAPVQFGSPLDAQRLGIAIIYQEPSLLPYLDVAENLFLGREPLRLGMLDRGRMNGEARQWLRRLRLDVRPSDLIFSLSLAQQRMVEIAKALALDAKVLMMDEPSASLTPDELQTLFEIIRELKSHNVAVVYVSHRLDEIFHIADRVTVLRDGRVIDTLSAAEATRTDLVRMMVGRPLDETFPDRCGDKGEVVLEVRHLSRAGILEDVSFQVRRGEIVGLAGLTGSGRTYLLKALFGAAPVDRGEILLRGQPVTFRHPRDAMRAGVGFVPEDRQGEGLVLRQPLRTNVSLPNLAAYQRLGFVHRMRERAAAAAAVDHLRIRTPSVESQVLYLSGGNQQKVVVAKWLAREPNLILLDEPTRGIDVGAKRELYAIMRDLARRGKALLVVSSELPELIGVSDRIITLWEGRITGIVDAATATEEGILTLATGGGQREELSRVRPRAPARWDPRWAVVGVYAVLLAVLLSAGMMSPTFRTPANLETVLRQAVPLGLVSVGQTICIISGGIDLSVSSVITVTALMGAVLMNGRSEMIVPAAAAVLSVGVLVGLVNSALVVVVRLPAFIATLGTMSILRGVALGYTKVPVGLTAPEVRWLVDGRVLGVPVPVLILLGVCAAGTGALRATAFGRHLYAVGGNVDLARLSGIATGRVRTASFLISSLAAALAGFYLVSRMGVGDVQIGPGFEFDSITAAVVGGTSLAGGRGSIVGTLAGVLIIIVLNNFMNQLNVNWWYQQVVKGIIILLAVSIYRQDR
jgi:ABC-type sugar transport system ATPase subunit/ribose/xylose/arabinose/galactoside ABC-type transport system permease subunit